MTEHRCWVYGDNVNTDVIFPGKYTYTVTEPHDIARHALEDLDPSFSALVRPGDVIIAGRNWGCGSSREQAVTCLKYSGIDVIIAGSFSRIYYRNCINQGLLPVTLPGIYSKVKTGDMIHFDRENWEIAVENEIYSIPVLSQSVQAILDAGGLIPMLQRRFNATDQYDVT